MTTLDFLYKVNPRDIKRRYKSGIVARSRSLENIYFRLMNQPPIQEMPLNYPAYEILAKTLFAPLQKPFSQGIPMQRKTCSLSKEGPDDTTKADSFHESNFEDLRNTKIDADNIQGCKRLVNLPANY